MTTFCSSLIPQPTLSEHRASLAASLQPLTDRIKRRPFANRPGQAAPACNSLLNKVKNFVDQNLCTMKDLPN